MKLVGWSNTVEVQPGKYVLGDPCYSVPDDYWMSLLNSCDVFANPVGVVNPRAKKYPFVVQRNDGKRFKMPKSAVLLGLPEEVKLSGGYNE